MNIYKHKKTKELELLLISKQKMRELLSFNNKILRQRVEMECCFIDAELIRRRRENSDIRPKEE